MRRFAPRRVSSSKSEDRMNEGGWENNSQASQQGGNQIHQRHISDQSNYSEDYDNNPCLLSPTAWLCEIGREKCQDTCNPFLQSFTNRAPKKIPAAVSSKKVQQKSGSESWRARATRTMLSGDSDNDQSDHEGGKKEDYDDAEREDDGNFDHDDENDDDDVYPLKQRHQLQQNRQVQQQDGSSRNGPGNEPMHSRSVTPAGSLASGLGRAAAAAPGFALSGRVNSLQQQQRYPPELSCTGGESRIVAPHVAKLSPSSVVELRLQVRS